MAQKKLARNPFRIDAEFKKLMPRPDESELKILKQSLMRDGVLTPLIVAKLPTGKPILIDGHTRWSIIRTHPSLKYRIKEMKFPSRRAAKLWVLDNQLSRRNLSKIEKVCIALEFEDDYKQLGLKNKGLSKGRGKSGRKDCPHENNVFEPIDTLASLGKIAGVGRSTIYCTKYILQHGPDYIVEKVRRGETTVRNAYFRVQDIKRREQRSEAARQNVKYRNPKKNDYIGKIICGDVIKVLKKMEPILKEQVTAFIFSPPFNCRIDYGKGNNADNLKWDRYGAWLGEVFYRCSKLLRPGGRIICDIASVANRSEKDYGNHYMYPTNVDLINKVREIDCGLKYFQEIIWKKYAACGKKLPYGTYCSPAKPVHRISHNHILIWSKDQWELPNINGFESDLSKEEYDQWVSSVWDVYPIVRANTAHPATFPPSLVERLLKMYTFPQDLVIDCFNGSGSTTTACATNNRRYCGVDFNSTYCAYARKRTNTAYKEFLQSEKNRKQRVG